jgi:hypothetical protein
MTMPKGQKFDHGYATASMGYREISEYMTERGDKMNHSTARNVFLSAMRKLSSSVCSMMDPEKSGNIEDIARDPRFQDAVESYLREGSKEKGNNS